MTLKVLIVDDEPIIVQGLRETVPWNDLGAEVIGEAYDGEEAIDILQHADVDIILSDVKMPVMDGLKLREWVHNHAPHIPTIMISGYEEFEYAQRAIRLGVKDYLLKPVDIDDLMALVKSISDETLKEREKRCRQSLQELLSATVMEYEVDAGPDLSEKRFLLLGSEIQQYGEKLENMDEFQEQQLKQRWKIHLEKELEKKGMICASFFCDQNRLITMCVLQGGDGWNKAGVQGIKAVLEKKADVDCFICIAPFTENIGELKGSYQDLLRGMECYPFHPESVYHAAEVRGDSQAANAALEEEIKQIFQAEVSETAAAAEKLFMRFTQNRWPLARVCAAITSLENSMIEDFPEQLPLTFQSGVNTTVYNSYDLLKKLFLQDIHTFMSYQKSAAQDGQRWLMKKAVSYIHKHYADDLKAAEVAGIINVTPNYFSQLIKQETGKHFNDYLHEVRLQQAKLLLKETPCRIFEIAEQVGYRDYKYFVHIFKKSTSLTPTQYRNIVHTKQRGENE
ncbi:two component transcriptional regulator, AraC family [Bacillus sp. OV194]|nr:two component transcriptional regulator, AraC family [Bacillus sp. OV194]